MKPLDVVLLLPVYNEKKGLRKVIKDLPLSDLEKHGYKISVLVVDNNSSDGSGKVAKKLGAIVVNEKKQGYGYAYKRGLSYIKSNSIVVTMDADGTYPVAELPEILNYFVSRELDFITTNRFGKYGFFYLKTMPMLNRFGNAALTALFFVLYRVSIKDSHSGMWVFRSKIIPLLKIKSNQMGFSQEIKLEAFYYNNIKCEEVAINYFLRVGEKKNRAFKDGLLNVWDIISKRFNRF